MFLEPVLSVILRCDAEGDGLILWPAGRKPQSGEVFAVPERPGCAVCLQGASRFEFVHSVPPVSDCRISMSWRWFKPEYMRLLMDQAGLLQPG
mmetsp:Transcript_52713/g.142072  ORF Transcript_52713/g.142072 Transcript_52713/m.142072 type:complete len:93 (-) Transcript_52713:31-309(-)